MRKEKEKIIKGKYFKVTQLGFSDGIEILTTLGRLLGPVVSDGKSDKNAINLISNIVSHLSFSDIEGLTEKLAKSTRIERDPGKWPILEPEVDLAGEYDLAMRWLIFALEVNYGDFFAEGGLLSDLVGPTKMT